MNKLEVGMYIRTSELYGGLISHITKVCEETKTVMLYWTGVTQYPFKEIEKASHNIIDLIQENDFVNGHRVIQVDRKSLELDIENSMYGCGCETINGDRDIRTIVTKEQFKSMEYRLGE